MAVLDLVARDPRVTRVTLVEPDTYAPHNVYRHLFPPSGVGRRKAELAAEWVRAVRPDVSFDVLVADVTDPGRQDEFAGRARACDVGVCAADNEAAKFAFDALLRGAGKPWTLGEVLSGGIGGWVHRFVPGGACYGCVASHLKREVTEQPAGPPPDYDDPGGARPETTVPASKASIAVIAGLHASVTLEVLGRAASAGASEPPQAGATEAGRVGSSDFTSLLFSLQVVPGVFEGAYRAHRLRIARAPACLICGTPAPVPSGEQLDAAVADALARLGAG
jgi:molybdopterin/thiamine biosynthesis adenylyltransferase